NLKHPGHSVCPANSQTPQDRTPHEYNARPECDRLEHVAAPPNSAVDIDFARIAHRIGHIWERLASRRCGIQLASAMIRYHHRFRTVLHGAHGIVASDQTFHHDWQAS